MIHDACISLRYGCPSHGGVVLPYARFLDLLFYLYGVLPGQDRCLWTNLLNFLLFVPALIRTPSGFKLEFPLVLLTICQRWMRSPSPRDRIDPLQAERDLNHCTKLAIVNWNGSEFIYGMCDIPECVYRGWDFLLSALVRRCDQGKKSFQRLVLSLGKSYCTAESSHLFCKQPGTLLKQLYTSAF